MGKSPNSNLLIEIFALVILTSYLIILVLLSYLLSSRFDPNDYSSRYKVRKISDFRFVIIILTFILSIGLNFISVYILNSNNYATNQSIDFIVLALLIIYILIFILLNFFIEKTKLDPTNKPFRYFINAILALIFCSLALFFGTYSKYIHINLQWFDNNDNKTEKIIWCLALIDITITITVILYMINYMRPTLGQYYNNFVTSMKSFFNKVSEYLSDTINRPINKDPFEGFYFGGEYIDKVIPLIEDFRDSGGWSIL